MSDQKSQPQDNKDYPKAYEIVNKFKNEELCFPYSMVALDEAGFEYDIAFAIMSVAAIEVMEKYQQQAQPQISSCGSGKPLSEQFKDDIEKLRPIFRFQQLIGIAMQPVWKDFIKEDDTPNLNFIDDSQITPDAPQESFISFRERELGISSP